MTAYFDTMSRRLHSFKPTDFEAIRDWEHQLVYDCSLASLLPGFPEQYREPLNQVIIQHGVATAPQIAEPDFEHQHQHIRRLECLCSDLHSIFHAVVQNGGYSDSPMAYPHALTAQAEDDRNVLAFRLADPTNPRVQAVATRTLQEMQEFGIEAPETLVQLCHDIAEIEAKDLEKTLHELRELPLDPSGDAERFAQWEGSTQVDPAEGVVVHPEKTAG